MTSRDAARLIDISAVRTQHTLKDIQDVVEIAKKYQFINVHSLPCWTKQVAELLKDEPEIYVGAPVGFPGGAHKTEVKVLEAQELVKDGVQEMDIVMNVGKFKNKEYDYVAKELAAVLAVAPDYVKTKVILEINCLTDEEMLRACEMVIDSGADFIKTSTGFSKGGATREDVKLMRANCPASVKVKAAGGISSLKDAEDFIELGAERLGTSRIVKLAMELENEVGAPNENY